MAWTSQGTLLRRQSTVAGSTATVTINTASFTTVSNRWNRSDAGSFITDTFTTSMRLITSSTKNPGPYTIKTVAATYIEIYETNINETPTTSLATGVNYTLTGNAFLPIGEVRSIGGPTGSASILDVTHLRSTMREKMTGLPDEGQVTFEVFLEARSSDPSSYQHKALYIDRQNKTLRNYDIHLTDSTTKPTSLYFSGYVTGMAMNSGVDNPLTASITLELTSAVSWSSRV